MTQNHVASLYEQARQGIENIEVEYAFIEKGIEEIFDRLNLIVRLLGVVELHHPREAYAALDALCKALGRIPDLEDLNLEGALAELNALEGHA